MARDRPRLLAAIALLAALVSTGELSRSSLRSLPEAKPRVIAGYGNLPLHFEANHGQTDEQVRFLARGRGYGLFLTPTESVLVLRRSKEASAAPAVVRMTLLGANPRPTLAGRQELSGKSNYFIGNDPKKWRADVPQYARVEYEDVYPGVGLTYYGNQGQLEYDFVVAPGADLKQIRLGIEGVDALRIDDEGNLVLSLPDGEVVHRAPVIYQETEAGRRPVDGRVVLKGEREFGFEVGAYDPATPLVLDPVLAYSTYFGGSLEEQGRAVTVDGAGNSYVVGFTMSTDLPTTEPIQGSNGGGQDAFLLKLSPAGSVVYSTYLGGSSSDGAMGVAVDGFGSVYVMGFTSSTDWPTASPLQAANAGGLDTFVAKLNAAGSALTYSTYLGGSGGDQGNSFALDAAGNMYLTGFTTSGNFPTVNPIQAFFGGWQDVFVAKLNPAGSALVYSTYLGGIGMDIGWSIAADSSGAAYVAGVTFQSDFPGANPLPCAPNCSANAFVSKLDPAGSALVYSRYLGGSGADTAYGVAVDALGNAYVTGTTDSTDFATVNPLQAAFGGGIGDAFVAKLNAAGSALIYSTYLGGDEWDEAYAVAVDGSGRAAITGATVSLNFPVVKAVQSTHGGQLWDVFVAQLAASGSELAYSTFLGGRGGADFGIGLTADPAGTVVVTGITDSPDFPTRHGRPAPSQSTPLDAWEAFVARIGPGSPPPGDFDFDGKPDILWRDQGSTGHIAVWFMNGTKMTAGTLTNPSPFSLLNWRIVGTNDFNGDDKQDILWRDQGNTGQIAVWFMDGTTMTSATLTTPGAFPLLNWRIVGTGDFDGDRKPDILWRDQASTGQIAVWFMDGTTMTSATLTDPGSFPLLNWEIVGTGDFNADGKTDILWRDTRQTGRIAVWFMDGTTVTGATLTDPPSFPLLNWEIVGTGDFNADGKPDILWRDQGSTGQIAVWFMDGTTLSSATLTDPPAVPILSWKIVGPR